MRTIICSKCNIEKLEEHFRRRIVKSKKGKEYIYISKICNTCNGIKYGEVHKKYKESHPISHENNIKYIDNYNRRNYKEQLDKALIDLKQAKEYIKLLEEQLK